MANAEHSSGGDRSAFASALVAGARLKAPTMASVLARRLESEVVDSGWAVGTVLGSESALLARYGVSRAVLREAIRIVEHTGAASMRRGPGGGLVVARPNRDALVEAIGVWGSFVRLTMAEIFELRRPLLLGTVRLAAERMRPEIGAGLLGSSGWLGVDRPITIDQLARFESMIAASTGNPALMLFTDTLGDLGIGRLRAGSAVVRPRFSAMELRDHAKGYRNLMEAVAAGRPDEAVHIKEELLDVVTPRMFDQRVAVPRRRADPARGKLGEQLAGLLRDDLERAGWPVGEVLASETELIERHGVSRAILREALRILEHHGAVRTKRGPGGGVIVTAPDIANIVRSVQLYLEYEGVGRDSFVEARSLIEVAAAELAAQRRSPSDSDALRAALQLGAYQSDQVSLAQFHERLAAISQNRLVTLFVVILAVLSGRYHVSEAEGGGPTRMARQAQLAHRGIVDAVSLGDPTQAGRRMERHLQGGAEALC